VAYLTSVPVPEGPTGNRRLVERFRSLIVIDQGGLQHEGRDERCQGDAFGFWGSDHERTQADGTAAAGSTPIEDFDAEGRLPGDSPSERVGDYVLFTCRGSDNNPGPPATEPPMMTPAEDDGGDDESDSEGDSEDDEGSEGDEGDAGDATETGLEGTDESGETQ